MFAIRQEVTNSLIKLSEKYFDKAWLEGIYSEKIDEFAKHEKFMMRIMAVHQINKIHSEVTPNFNNSVICPTLLKLAEDPVPNIRFNVSKTIGEVAKHMSNANLVKLKAALKKMSETDTDFDAQFFA